MLGWLGEHLSSTKNPPKVGIHSKERAVVMVPSTLVAVTLKRIPQQAGVGGGSMQGHKRTSSRCSLEPTMALPGHANKACQGKGRKAAQNGGSSMSKKGDRGQGTGDRGQGTGDRKGKRAHLGLVHNMTAPAPMKAALTRRSSYLYIDFVSDCAGYA